MTKCPVLHANYYDFVRDKTNQIKHLEIIGCVYIFIQKKEEQLKGEKTVSLLIISLKLPNVNINNLYSRNQCRLTSASPII